MAKCVTGLSQLFRYGPFVMALAIGTTPVAGQTSTATGTIAISATVLSFCNITASATLPFGNYSSVALPGSTTLTVSCTNGSTYNVGLSVGNGSGATVAARQMTLNTSTLTYSLYSDTGHTIVWGPTIGTNTVTGTGNGANQVLTVYGLIPAGQLVTTGNYTDSVTATITY